MNNPRADSVHQNKFDAKTAIGISVTRVTFRKSAMQRRKELLLALWVVGCLSISTSASAAGEATRKIRAAITSISGAMVPPWAAHEAGIFRRHGLDVEVIAMPSGIQGMGALIAGEVALCRLPGEPRQGQRLAAPT
jgi:hypothetical protein